jgi:hypothetical protein
LQRQWERDDSKQNAGDIDSKQNAGDNDSKQNAGDIVTIFEKTPRDKVGILQYARTVGQISHAFPVPDI